MNKKLLSLIIILVSTLIANAQFGYGSYEDVAKLKKTKTYVVLTDLNESFNKNLKASVEKNWKITEYQYIKYSELEKLSINENNSFIVVSGYNSIEGIPSKKIQSEFYTRDSSTLEFYSSFTAVLNVQIGGKKFNDIKNMIVMCYSGIDYSYFFSSKLDVFVKMLNTSIELIESKKLDELKWKESEDLFNPGMNFSDKIIVFWEKDIPIITHTKKTDKKFLQKEEIEKIFTKKYKIVDESELSDALNNKDENNLFFGSFVEGTFSVIYLYDYNGKIVFFSKIGRMAGNCTFWWKSVLETLNEEIKQ